MELPKSSFLNLNKYFLLSIIVLICLSCSVSRDFRNEENSSSNELVFVTTPIIIEEAGLHFIGTENLIPLPENRSNKKSRNIGIHFFHFPAKDRSNLPPVFYLPGGPGGYFTKEHFYQKHKGKNAAAWTRELSIYNQKRDLVIINQRGNSNAPGMSIPKFEYSGKVGAHDRALIIDSLAINERNAIVKAFNLFEQQGYDPAGYDIINIIQDIEDIRAHLHYDKIALVGSSFGAQWALGYIQLFEDRVDRAILSAVEPLDHSRDDPKFVWNAFKRLSHEAHSDPAIRDDLPEVGLTEAIKIILERLGHEDVTVQLKIPSLDKPVVVVIGPDDVRANLFFPFAQNEIQAIESWPKYISELFRGDYRALALWAYQAKNKVESQLLLAPLIDHSLGISDERSKVLQSREELKLLGNQNRVFELLEDEILTPQVGDEIRTPKYHDIPILLIQGNLDTRTPIENSYYLLPYLRNGHLVEITRGSHTVKRDLVFQHPEMADLLFDFINYNFDQKDIGDFAKTLPIDIEMRSFNFVPIYGTSLFEYLVRK